ncbi:KH domain-containing protein [Thermoflavimicrobium dichotomicum]|uniref:RNA-binding protein KhpA n=1 Tax=Thermoflavimicrobium dichotomicum TaxID=46223 RepID=A0A1I3UB26_9BACL|nr:KH domain-containing protein [Thermoflavimicrobium dichotomicum]SFJ80200.1 hypothetical protein SAMN05421852_12315 [Thermoflavimicrobium dichotomicum]
MKELVEYIAQSLVDHPDQVRVTEEISDDQIKFRLSVAPEDLGKVIGVGGQVIHSIRNVVQAGGLKENKRVQIEAVKGGSDLVSN